MIIHIGIPVIDGKPYAGTVDSLLAEQLFGFQKGIHLLVDWEIGCSLIGHARNRIVKRFLAQNECACLIFVDADISWRPGVLTALAQRDEQVIGGTYRAKRDDERFHYFGDPEQVGDLYRVLGLPGGFMKISRDVFSKIRPNAYLEDDGSATSDFFPTGFHEGRFYGEDYGFCRLWRETGGDVWLDPSIQLRHHDGCRVYEGNVRKHLKERNVKDTPASH